ncbi:hypothetical protein PISMIDRAFT_105882, partial [Pisolithus microcarpus 441]
KMIILAWKRYMDSLKVELLVGHVTMDNAENNNTMMEALEKLIHKCNIHFDKKDRHIHCLPHILNICSGHVINALTDEALFKIAGTWVSTLLEHIDNQQTYKEALEGDLIGLGHKVVQALCSSGQRQDVCHHAFQIPHQAIHTLSSECLPTLCKDLITFEKFYKTWIRLGQDERNPQLHIFVHKGLEWVERYYKCMGDTKAYIISMHKYSYFNAHVLLMYLLSIVLNPNCWLMWVKKSWSTGEYKKAKQIVLQTVSASCVGMTHDN